MKRLLLLSLLPIALGAAAQTMDHSAMPGMVMPGDQQKPTKKTAKKPAPAANKSGAGKSVSPSKPHGAVMEHSAMPGMTMPAGPQSGGPSSMPGMKMTPAQPPSNHSTMPGMNKAAPGAHDHSSMPGMTMPSAQPSQKQPSMPGMAMPSGKPPMPDHAFMPGMNMSNTPGHNMASMGSIDVPHSPPPPPPGDRAANRFFAPAVMADARAQLQREHGGESVSMVMLNLAEYQVKDGADGFRWDGQAWYGGDIHRFVLKSEGEATGGEGVESAELQALYSRAIGVYTDAQFGLRQDFEPHNRTYATIGVQSLLPYWFDIEASLYLSNKGEFLGRFEGTYDLLLTNYLILQPRAELNFAAQNTLETRTGSGLSDAELGLRLRYEITREFAPYIGVSWDRQFGQTANYSRALGKSTEATSIVFGIRTFF